MHYVYLRDYRKGKMGNQLVGDPANEEIISMLGVGIIKPRDEEEEAPAPKAKPKAKPKAEAKPAPKKKITKKKTSKKK